jgi:hypothetical protein
VINDWQGVHFFINWFYYGANAINLSHMRRGGVYPLPLLFAILREGVNPSPTLVPLKLTTLMGLGSLC